MIKNQLGRTTSTKSNNRLFFFHNQYIVNSCFVNLGIAYIFKISLHILLSVQIIRAHFHFVGCFHGKLHDFLIILKGHFLILIPEDIQPCCAFYCKRMYSKTVWIQCLYLFQCILYHGIILARKAYDQIHVNIVKSLLSCQFKCLLCIFYRMLPADQIQSGLIHSLWIYRNPGNRKSMDRCKFFFCNAIRPACFHSKFKKSIISKLTAQTIQQPLQLIRLQCSRCSSANINRIQLPAKAFHKAGHSFSFFAQRIQIFVSS